MSIDLDKRIKEGKKPLTAFDEMESKFIGTDCFFSDKPSDFADLSKCQVGTLVSRDGMTGVFNATKNNSYANFDYCLPGEWVEEEKNEPEKKYRPFKDHTEYKEYLNDGIIESWIQIREKLTGEVSELMYVGGSKAIICLGAYSFDLNNLFYDFELFNESTGEWQPFGVLEE